MNNEKLTPSQVIDEWIKAKRLGVEMVSKYPYYMMLPFDWRYRVNNEADAIKGDKLFAIHTIILFAGMLVAFSPILLLIYELIRYGR